jgi:hypothetical protein
VTFFFGSRFELAAGIPTTFSSWKQEPPQPSFRAGGILYLTELNVLARGTPCSRPLLLPLTRKPLPTERGLAPSTLFPSSQWPAPVAQNCLAAVGPAAAACLLLLDLAANWRIRPTERGALQVPSFALLLSHHIPNSDLATNAWATCTPVALASLHGARSFSTHIRVFFLLDLPFVKTVG